MNRERIYPTFYPELINPTKRLRTELSRVGHRELDGTYRHHNPQELLESASMEGIIVHASSRKIRGPILPHQAVDTAKASGNSKASYLTDNPKAALFVAFTGGLDMPERQDFVSMRKTASGITYGEDPIFSVGNPHDIAEEGYIYFFDGREAARKIQVLRKDNGVFVSNEYASRIPLNPLGVLKVVRGDFRHEIERTSELKVAFPAVTEVICYDRLTRQRI